ncbi:hypothetical protein BaRGS_00037595 [Batillaria attramentaria]|uniref:Uncharacterized protein n=1 Tax=Batillaria attramentaria TaxID=370345 RepID=A0ABD0J891_9CAEN
MGTTYAKKHQEDEESEEPNFNSPFSPQRERAYLGPPLEYSFVDTQVSVRPQVDGYTRTPSLSSEDEGHYTLLEQPYTRGFHLMHFTKIPGGIQCSGHLNNSSVLIDFQGIFCRNPATCNTVTCTELRVEKAWMQANRVHGSFLSRSVQHIIDVAHVEESINRAAQGGERLLCVASTGQEDCRQNAATNGNLTSVMRVDLFYEMTSQLTSEQYTYTIALVPCKVSYTSQVMFRPVPQVQCDWRGTLTQHLSQGWRLVDIYIDIPTVSQFFDPKSQDFSPTTMNALWFFEKPVSRLEDETPRYEGKVIEHAVKVKSHTMGSSAVPGWEYVIQDMGRRGWELACVVETHTMECVGLTEVLLKSLLFFQRPVVQSHSTSLTGSTSSLSD